MIASDVIGRLRRSFDEAVPESMFPEPGEWFPIPSAGDRDQWQTVDPRTRALVLAQAEASAAEPFIVPRATDFSRFLTDGDRSRYQGVYLQMRDRLAQATLAAAITAERRWVDEIIDGVWVICEQTTWCVPAHDHFAHASDSALPSRDQPFLDLFAAETGALLTCVDALAGDLIDGVAPLVRRRLRDEVRTRVLDPFRARHWWWFDYINNWNTWIVSNVLLTALHLDRDRVELLATVRKVIRGLDLFLDSYPDDGSCDEGASYWWAAGGRFGLALDLLSGATGDRFDAFGDAKVRAILDYLPKVHIDADWFVNVGDGAARLEPPMQAQRLARLGRRADLADLVSLAEHLAPADGAAIESTSGWQAPLLFSAMALTDPHWRARQPRSTSTAPVSIWMPDAQLLVAREAADPSRGLCVAAWGGHNAAAHNHNDVGNFIIAVDGLPIVVDAGVGTYTRQTFSDDTRYDIWTMQSSWHNLPDINGYAQRVGREMAARDVVVDESPSSDAISMDLAGAYPPDAGVAAWRRRVELRRSDSQRSGDARAQVTLSEQWELTGPPTDVRLHLLVNGAVSEQGPGRLAVDGPDGRGIEIGFDDRSLRVEVDVRELDDRRLTRVWGPRLHRITFVAVEPVEVGSTDVTFVAH